jgi:hypothetical protein
LKLLEDVNIEHSPFQYFYVDNYTQHNPQIADQLPGMGKALKEMGKAGITMKYDTIHKVLHCN